MKRIIILLALIGITGISGFAFSQDGFRDMTDEQILEKLETRLDKRIAVLTKKLKLTPQQVPKIREVLADGQTQIFELKKSDIKDRAEKKSQMKAIRKSTRTSIATYLTVGQNEKFAKLKKRGHGRKHGKKMLRKMAKRLDLDDAQKLKMKAIFKGKRTEMKALKASGASEVEFKAKRKEISKAAMKAFKMILSPVQLEQLKKFKKNRRNKRSNDAK